MLIGWANYYKYSIASEIFGRADFEIFRKLWRWSKRRHNAKGKYWVANKYYHRVNGRSWTFSVSDSHKKKLDADPIFNPWYMEWIKILTQ